MAPTANYLAYVARAGPPPRLLPVLELTLPQGTLYLSEAAFDRYEPRITPGGVGTVSRAIGLDATTVGEQRLDVTVANGSTRRMEILLEGAYDVRRSAVVLRRASPDLAEADWLTRYTGILDSWDWNVAAPNTVTLHFRPDDHALRNSFAPSVAILKSEWSEGSYVMPDGVAGTYAPYLYGAHSSSGVTGRGFVPLICVGYTGTTGRYLVSLGRAKTKIGTWKTSDGSSVSGTLELVTRGGKDFSTVNYASGITSGLGIWGDFDGYETVGDGTGTLISNPVAQLRHFLGLIYTDWRAGNWPTSPPPFGRTTAPSPPVDAASWEACADWCDRFKIEGSAYIGGTTQQTKAWVVVERWLESFPMFRLCWNASGQLAMVNLAAAIDWPGYPTSSSLLFDGPALSADRRPAVPHDIAGLARQVSGTYLFSASDGRSYGSLDVQDPSVIEKVVTNVKMDWSLARAA
jgi:hypothetical protein